MTEEEKNRRKLKVQEVLQVASLGGRTVSEKELELCEAYVEGKISLEELEEQADDLEWAGV